MMNDTPARKKAVCPNCGRHFEYDPSAEPTSMPFCSERCQWIDLGRWMSEDYRVSKNILASDDEQID